MFRKSIKVAVLSETKDVQVNETTLVRHQVFNNIDEQFTKILAQALHFSYELLTPSDGQLGIRLANGNYTGMIGMVQSGEADLAVSVLTISAERLEVIDFSYPFYMTSITFATRKPRFIPQLTTFLWPFAPEVWILLLLYFFILPFIFYVLFKQRYSLLKIVQYMYSSLLQKSVTVRPKTPRELFFMACWQINITLLTYCYSAVLLSFLTVPILVGVRTIPELSSAVSAGKYQCTSYPGSFVPNTLVNSHDPILEVIGLNLQQNKGTRDIEGVLGNPKSLKIPAFVAGVDSLRPFKYKYFISSDEFVPVIRGIAITKDFCCKKELDRLVGYVWASGIYSKMTSDAVFIKSLKTYHESSISQEEENTVRKLSMEDFKGAFVILFVGYAVSVVVLILELFVRNLTWLP